MQRLAMLGAAAKVAAAVLRVCAWYIWPSIGHGAVGSCRTHKASSPFVRPLAPHAWLISWLALFARGCWPGLTLRGVRVRLALKCCLATPLLCLTVQCQSEPLLSNRMNRTNLNAQTNARHQSGACKKSAAEARYPTRSPKRNPKRLPKSRGPHG